MAQREKNQSFRKAAIEFLIIVVGVLTALAADEWRQSIERDQLERELLGDVQKEFSTNLDRIDLTTSRFENIRVKLKALAETPAEEFESLAQDAARNLGQEAHIARPLLAPRTGVLRSVIDGGQLTSISDRHLRYAIAEWPTWLEVTQTMEQQEFTWFLESWVPAANSLFDAEADPRQHSDELLAAAGKQLYFVKGYLKSLGELREQTQKVLEKLAENESG